MTFKTARGRPPCSHDRRGYRPRLAHRKRCCERRGRLCVELLVGEVGAARTAARVLSSEAMPARDSFHDCVRRALERDGWTITHDPLRLSLGRRKLYIVFMDELGQILIDDRVVRVVTFDSEKEEIIRWTP